MSVNDRKIGLIAGWGDYPVTIARRLTDNGYQVCALGFHGHADPILSEICHAFQWTGLTKAGTQVRFFKKHGVHNATMAGKLFKTILFERFAWLAAYARSDILAVLFPTFYYPVRESQR